MLRVFLHPLWRRLHASSFLLVLLSATTALLFPPLSQAEIYLEPESFIEQAFDGEPPAPKVLWINKQLREKVEKILAHKAGFMRTRFRINDDKSVWILEEIGKTKPITVGIIVSQAKIESIKVLVFRESRGWEVRHSFFTDQFIGSQLAEDDKLNKSIDGISGATLSVRALTKLARIALLFDQTVRQ